MLPLLLLAGCMLPWDPAWNTTDADDSAPADDSADTGPSIIEVSGSIVGDTTWTPDNIYVLQELVFVEGSTLLTIEPGTTVQGVSGSALVVTREASLLARGHADAPIVFTSDQPEGSRAPGDWGGVVLLGDAPVNQLPAQIEGVPASDSRGAYGGSDANGTCGTLEYVRIEFAGFEVFANNDLNGLTLGGCGASTIVRYVQVHRGFDDGVELFGGTADLRNILITQAGDDSIDWDQGWTGRAQFVIAQQAPDDGDHGIEADNNEDGVDLEPRSAPTLYNLTILGSGNPDIAQRGILLRLGTAGTLRNVIVAGSTTELLDIRDEATVAQIDGGALTIDNLIAFDIGASGADFFRPETGADDDDGGFDEEGWLTSVDLNIRLGTDPGLPPAAFDLAAPDFVPAVNGAAATGAASPPEGEFWDQAATYIGAVRPGTATPWYAGWTAFPED
ncbi:MAG: hypothetical protein H6739_28580 [Alphaproteobacteria bacterium]|nr:hypothetical protein [Alphaproteobacteria bacterium]